VPDHLLRPKQISTNTDCCAVNGDLTASIQFPTEERLHEFSTGNQGDRYRFEANCCLMRSPSKAKEPVAQPNDQRTEP
jgi:hypothetical protein